MKYTLLDMVQRILSSMDSDEVNSISDTTESLQVAYVVQQVYNDMATNHSFPEQYNVFELEASGSVDAPLLMTMPSFAREVRWIKYNSFTVTDDTPNWQQLTPISLEEMLDRSFALVSTEPNVLECNIDLPDAIVTHVYGYNDRNPLFYAAINADTFLFDACWKSLDDTLQKSKSLAYGRVSHDFQLEDTFVAPLDEKQFSILLNEAKALAFAELKQASHAKAEKEARKGWINYARTRNNAPSTIPYRDRLGNYGRNQGASTKLSHGRNNNW